MNLAKSPNGGWFGSTQKLCSTLWNGNLSSDVPGPGRAATILIFAALTAYWALTHHEISDFLALRQQQILQVAFLLKPIKTTNMDELLVQMILGLAGFRVIYTLGLGLADALTYKRLTGISFRPEWAVTALSVNTGLALIGFAFINSKYESLVASYENLLQKVPVLISLSGPVAMIVACLIADFCFYVSHRWVSHRFRLFWELGHLYHHGSEHLTQLTNLNESPISPTNLARGFGILLLPLLSRLFTTEIESAGWTLLFFFMVDTLIQGSHSSTMFGLEMRLPFMKWVRLMFVTNAVHYMHHSSAIPGVDGTGCNFASRFTLWDRVFKTYVEPTRDLPKVGLFGAQGSNFSNPIRFFLSPLLNLAKDLRRVSVWKWPAVLFGAVPTLPLEMGMMPSTNG